MQEYDQTDQGGGWMKLYYRFQDWEWYGDPNMVALFIHLLLRANYKPARKGGAEYGRGVVLTSREQLARETGISEQSVRTCLNRLKSTNEITIRTTKKGSIITICNYDKYQNQNEITNQQNNQPTNRQSTNNQPTTNQQLTSCKEYKNIYLVVVDISRARFLEEFFSEQRRETVESFCMNLGVDVEKFRKMAEAVVDEWEVASVPPHPDLKSASQHLISQIRIKLAEERRREKETARLPAAGRQGHDAKLNDRWNGVEVPRK